MSVCMDMARVCTHPHCAGETSVGRGADCNLSIDAVSLSRKHAVILVEKGTHFVLDNASRNKTFRGVVSCVAKTGHHWDLCNMDTFGPKNLVLIESSAVFLPSCSVSIFRNKNYAVVLFSDKHYYWAWGSHTNMFLNIGPHTLRFGRNWDASCIVAACV